MGQRTWLVRGAPPRHALLINQLSSRTPISIFLLCRPPIYRIRSHRHTVTFNLYRLPRGILLSHILIEIIDPKGSRKCRLIINAFMIHGHLSI